MTIVVSVMTTTSLIYIGFGMICIVAWGNLLTLPLITDMLPNDPKLNPHDAWLGWTVRLAFCINLIFSFPLMLYPAHRVIENYLYHDWPKSKKR